MNSLSVVGGALCYEFRMQLRRRAVWIVVAALSLPFILLLVVPAKGLDQSSVQTQLVVQWAQILALFLPIGVGLLLADRLPRDRRTRVEEVLDTVPGGVGARLAGKYLGSTLATLAPVFLGYAGGTDYILTQVQSLHPLPAALAAFAAIVLPALLFVAAFSVACPVVLKVPLYQFLLTGYWLWANLLSPKIHLPTLTFTLLNAAGPWASEGFFHVHWFFFPPRVHVAVWQAVANIALLLALGTAVLVAAWGYLGWRQARR